MLTIRKAELRDVPDLHQLINHYAAEHVLLPRTLDDISEHIGEFTVAEENGKLLGCGALKFYSRNLAEVRSLCVEGRRKSNGVGKKIAKSLLLEAERSGLKTLFALTVAPGFFSKLGFREVPRENFPSKIRRDCQRCELYATCTEKAVTLDLAPRRDLQPAFAFVSTGASS